jgi:hypothetical protein
MEYSSWKNITLAIYSAKRRENGSPKKTPSPATLARHYLVKSESVIVSRGVVQWIACLPLITL